ncbi:MAG TPA: hypothetical protein VMB77_00450, partial [Syntrophales bacterium]|nr:hypothetical protein [Syntrophales bacterium]
MKTSSQLLCSLLSREAGSIVQHGEDDTDELVGYGKQGLPEGEAFRLSSGKIGFERSLHPNRTKGHQPDQPPEMPIPSFG